MGLLSFFTPKERFKRRLFKVRKRWDRTREKGIKKEPPSKDKFLERLDRIEQDLRTVEEKEDLNKWTRKKMANEIELELEKIRDAVDAEVHPPKEEKEMEDIEELEKRIKDYEK
ncbi:MAG: hypothetical protein ACP5E4_04365 [Candidatus Aenigmatarchaeota archaeon]